MFVQEKSHQDFQIVTTEDSGLTWTPPVTVLEAPVWNISTPMLTRPDAIYWAMDYSPAGTALLRQGDGTAGARKVTRGARLVEPLQHRPRTRLARLYDQEAILGGQGQ